MVCKELLLCVFLQASPASWVYYPVPYLAVTVGLAAFPIAIIGINSGAENEYVLQNRWLPGSCAFLMLHGENCPL